MSITSVCGVGSSSLLKKKNRQISSAAYVRRPMKSDEPASELKSNSFKFHFADAQDFSDFTGKKASTSIIGQKR